MAATKQLLRYGNMRRFKSYSEYIKPTVLVHGGAGDIKDNDIEDKKRGVKLAACAGYDTLMTSNSSVVDAVEIAVRMLEMNPKFNAGLGSALTIDGTVEMDASIMLGSDLNCGCVSGVSNIFNPVTLARTIMEQSRFKYLAGEGATGFAREHGFHIVSNCMLITQEALSDLEHYIEHMTIRSGSPGTVGAVAIDGNGNVAAATSSGGRVGKSCGRIGDSPIIGAATYADNSTGAVSVTGHGEAVIRYNVASKILAYIHFQDLSAQEAAEKVLNDMTKRFKRKAGVVCIDGFGTVGVHFTTSRMPWACRHSDELRYGVEPLEQEVEILDKMKA